MHAKLSSHHRDTAEKIFVYERTIVDLRRMLSKAGFSAGRG